MALIGQFEHATGQPHLEGRLILPRLNIRAKISFLVDTGADRTLLMPQDSLDMRLDYNQLAASAVSIGIVATFLNQPWSHSKIEAIFISIRSA